jgi:hypothetical protein
LSDVTALLGLAQALLVLAVFWLPGLAVLRSLGFRGWLRSAAVAPVVTVSVFFAGAWLAAILHVRWSLAVALGCAGVVVLGGLAVRRLRSSEGAVAGPSLASTLRSNRLAITMFAAAVLLQLIPVWRPILRRQQVPNLGDPVFHLNALEYVRLDGVAAPTTLATLLDPGHATALYPTGWHAVAGVVPVLLDNTSLMAAATFVVIAVAWTLGLAALGREVEVAAPRLVMLLAGALSACGLSSPLERALELGIIPDAVGLAFAPGAAALVIAVLRDRPRSGRSAAWVVLVLVAFGLGACHPSALVGVALLALPWLVSAIARWWPSARRPARAAGAVAGVVVLAAGVAFIVVNPLVGIVRSLRVEDTMTVPDAFAGLIFGVTFHTVTWGVVVPAFALGASVLRFRGRQDLRPIIAWALLGALYVLASTNATWALGVTGLFYGEGRRISPLTAALAIVLAAEGMARFTLWMVSRTDLPAWLPFGRAVAMVSGFLVLLTPWQQVFALPGAASEVYTTTPVPSVSLISLVPYFTPDELRMVDRLPSELGPDAVLYGTVRSGVSLVYGLAGVRTMPFAQSVTADLDGLEPRLAGDIESDPAVCATLRAHGVTHVYVDTRLLKLRGEFELADPFGQLPAKDFRLVDEGGYAKVYEITGCAR